MNLVRTEKVYEKQGPDGIQYYLHEVESNGQVQRYLTLDQAMGRGWMPGGEFERGRVTYRITSDFEIKEERRKPSLDELSARIRLVAQKLVDTKTCVEVLEVACPHCNGETFEATFLLRFGAKPLEIGCGAAPDYLTDFIVIDDDWIVSEVLDVFSADNVERIESSYMGQLHAIEEWLK